MRRQRAENCLDRRAGFCRIDRANDDVAKLLLLDKIVRSGMIQKGEIRIQNSGMMPIDFAFLKYGKSVAALANADFDRTRAAADRFERQELRLMARLLLAQALLRRDEQMQSDARGATVLRRAANQGAIHRATRQGALQG